ncbi:S-Ena type endospore appendage [Rossellomorea sp. NPDC077527]|uniref:S-Ena type endospore appendage n=1 Tax=Rossellomorea sp. NPDC077527 TaxID=3364510 RepID=UPI0037CB9038
MYEDKCEELPKHCPEEIKGLDLCKKKEEMKCFKHCAPISQPCDCQSYNHFTSRANLEFSGLIVVKNTGNPTSGCAMEVCVTDGCGSDLVAIVTPGSSVPVFVEGLISLDIACGKERCKQPGPGTCTGEIIFDLEYCITTYVTHPHDGGCC